MDSELNFPDYVRSDLVWNVRGDDSNSAALSLLGLTYDEPDRIWIENFLLRTIADEDLGLEIRRLAMTCLGHSARIRGEIGSSTVMPVLNQLLHDPKFAGYAEDALDDVEAFTSE